MNKLTLLLQDKEAIAEIAKDPEVQIKIKDAILDGAIRRAAKTTEGIASMIAAKLREELTDGSMWCNNLNEKYRKIIKDEAINAVSSFVCSEIKSLTDEVRRTLNTQKAIIFAKLEDVELEKIIREEIRKAVNEKFK